MNEREFEELLEDVRRRPLPSCPGNFAQNVRRRIRLARGESKRPGDWLATRLFRPVFLAATLAVAIGSSFTTALMMAPSVRPSSAESARVALGFDAFSHSLSLPTDHHP